MDTKNIIIALIVVIVIGGGAWWALRPAPEIGLSNSAIELPLVEDEEPEIIETENELAEVLSRVDEIGSLKYEIFSLTPEGEFSAQFWQKNNQTRMETTAEGQAVIMLANFADETAYIYLPDQNIALGVGLAQAPEIVEGSLKQQAAYLMDYDPVIVERETIDGRECLVIEYAAFGEATTMWIWEEHGLPIRTITETEYGLIESTASNIEFLEIADDMFELPAEVEIIETPSF